MVTLMNMQHLYNTHLEADYDEIQARSIYNRTEIGLGKQKISHKKQVKTQTQLKCRCEDDTSSRITSQNCIT